MAELPLAEGIGRFKQNEDRFDRFTNGSDTQTFITSGGTPVSSIRKFLKDKNDQINIAADGILAESVAALNASVAARNASQSARDESVSAKNDSVSARNAAQAWAEGTEPGGEGTKSSREYAEAIEALISSSNITYFAPDRANLKSIDTTQITSVFLREAGREGLFTWVSGNFSTLISLDTREGVYIKANAVAASAGAWVRVGIGGLNIRWFGAQVAEGVDDSLAVQACANMMMVLKTWMIAPAGKVTCNSKITHVFSPSATGPSDDKNTYGCFKIRGAGWNLTEFYFPNSDGFELTASSFQHTFDLDDFTITTGAEGGFTALKVKNRFAYFGEYNARNYFNLVIRGADGYGNVKYWGCCVDLFNISNVVGRGLLVGPVKSAIDATDSTFKNFGIGMRLASAADPDDNPATHNSTEPGWGTQYDFTGMRSIFLGLAVEIGAGVQGIEFGPGTKWLVGYSGLEVIPGVTEVRQIHMTGVEISGRGTPFRARSGVPSLKIEGCHIAFGSGKNGIILETNTGAANGGGSTINNNTFNASEAGASDGIYINTNFNAIVINNNTFNGMNTGVELTANSAKVTVGDANAFDNIVGQAVLDLNSNAGNFLPPRFDYGTVTQETNKATIVAITKRCGLINTHNAALGAGATATFTVTNGRIRATDVVTLNVFDPNYTVRVFNVSNGSFGIAIKNESGGSLSTVAAISFFINRCP